MYCILAEEKLLNVMLLSDHVTSPINTPGSGSALYDVDTDTPVKYDDGLIPPQTSDLAFPPELDPHSNIIQTG